jgi:hypothetical protein
MPGSPTPPGQPGTCDFASVCVAFRDAKRVGARDYVHFEAQWLACVLPCQRFASALAGRYA